MDFHKLIHAVQYSDIACFLKEQNLSKCLHIFHKKTGDSVLHLVCRFGRRDLLEQFSSCDGVDLEITNYEGKKPLHEASHFGHLDCVEFLLQSGVQVNCLKRADWTPLMLACTKCQVPVIAALLKHGADPALVNKDAWNSFHIAAREGCVEVLQTLLAHNAVLWNTVSHNGRTPLHTAALHGHLETVRFLLNKCEYITDAADSCGVTPVMDALRAGFVDVAALLISMHKADVGHKDNLGRQALHHAAQAGQVGAADFLVSTGGVPVNAATPEASITALHLAAKEGQDAVIQLLVQNGADVNLTDNKGRTALHIARAAQHSSSVNVLLLASEAVDTVNCDGL
ncbi:hypothetical protein ACOMHN_053740 [Nucella lapillus]